MKIALVAQNATPLRPRAGSGPDRDDIGLSELTRKLAGQGHQVTVYAQKNLADLVGVSLPAIFPQVGRAQPAAASTACAAASQAAMSSCNCRSASA